ncbi:MAG TPA: patatin-like phospholipase family protein [Acidobacteriaceae bacterium]|nr:patatin-like phospholipase family protein [Acidobacteriaceae bacterium]
MAKRVAITIAGAVSLGAYEAGVLYELLEAFRSYNAECDRTNDPDRKIYVDVLTGASAGGMTAAMLGQRLMFDGASLEEAETNPLYRTWVERIDIKQLVRMQRDENKWHSLLSSDLIETIGREALVDSMAPGQTLSGAHSVIEQENGKPKPLDVGLAMTNLNGVDYMLRIVGSDEGGFNYARSDDQMLFHIQADDRGNVAKWERMRGAAVASGAFPAAFRPKGLKRQSCEYGTALPSSKAHQQVGKTYVDWGAEDIRRFAYADGGVLQNQPLGMAKNFVDARVKAAQESGRNDANAVADDRLYVLISPHAVKSQARDKLRAERMTIASELVELFHTYIRQATFHDWIVAEGMNVDIHSLDNCVALLMRRMTRKPFEMSLTTNAKQLTQFTEMFVPGPTRRSRTLDRLKMQYAKEYQQVLDVRGADEAEAFLDAIATLEAAAGLGQRDLMKIVAVLADGRTELAGSGLAAFVGFFSKAFREHDYWMGRVKTRVYLQRGDVKRILGVDAWPEQSKWGGQKESEVMKKLPNPTEIGELPLSLGQMLGPGMGSLLLMVKARPAVLWVVGVVLLAAVLGVAGVVVLIVWAVTHGACCVVHASHGIF